MCVTVSSLFVEGTNWGRRKGRTVESGAISDLTSCTLGPGERTKPLSWLEGIVGKQAKQGLSFHFLAPPRFFVVVFFFRNVGQRKQSLIVGGEFTMKAMKLKDPQGPFLVEAPYKTVYLI